MRRYVLALGIFVSVPVVCAATCDHAPVVTPRDLTTSRPTDAPNRPPASQTLYSTGWVDNGGRTSDEYSRTEMSGYRATEMGSDRQTGTPGTGMPIPGLEPYPPRMFLGHPGEPREGMGERLQATGTPNEAVVASFVQAACERERSCDRIGQGRKWDSASTCMQAMRSRAREDVEAAGCRDDINATKAVSCSSAIRHTACGEEILGPADVAACEPVALCIPR